ncbi:MAG TPA: DUF3575 domain-containing protein [Candidatus Cryptobacteroides pullicola]|nr:DUF3575 domain-containing protein [Candidatus Cryptobacteroides pullicola]
METRKVVRLHIVSVVLFLFFGGVLSEAREVRDSVKIYFRQGYSVLDMSIRDNAEVLGRIADSLRWSYTDSLYTLKSVEVVGGASPEGTIPLNRRLSEKRANVLFDYLSQYGILPDSLTTFTFLGRDWGGLLELVEQDDNVPYREETIEFLRDIISRCEGGEKLADNNVSRLSRFMGGAPYRYMYRELFPEIRASRVYLTYDKTRNPIYLPFAEAPDVILPPPSEAGIGRSVEARPLQKPFYIALKTNMLYDALLVPNASVELYLGRNWSISGGWMHGWWKSDPAHWYWRMYGGDLSLRRWFGRRAGQKPLTGHHIGIYGSAFTYDFENGGRGYLGGQPGGTLLDRANFSAGIEYGYSLPVARRLNLDFTVGLGWIGGQYHEYLPIDDCYVWQSTSRMDYFGPTKLEVSLVWLLGRGNINYDKGGRR